MALEETGKREKTTIKAVSVQISIEEHEYIYIYIQMFWHLIILEQIKP
jgi:hypothetical protein